MTEPWNCRSELRSLLLGGLLALSVSCTGSDPIGPHKDVDVDQTMPQRLPVVTDDAYFPLDGNYEDAVGGKKAHAFGKPVFDVDRHGSTGKALRFDGQDDSLRIHAKVTNGMTSGTITFWLKLDDAEVQYNMFAKRLGEIGLDGSYSLRAQFGSPGLGVPIDRWGFQVQEEVATGGEGYTPSGNYGVTNWHKYTFTWSDTTKALYLDQQQIAAFQGSYDAQAMFGDLLFSPQSLPRNEMLKGLLDDIRIYHRELGPQEIASQYLAEKPPIAALQLDGFDDSADIPGSATFDVDELTVEAWVRLDTNLGATQARIVNRQSTDGGFESWGLEIFGDGYGLNPVPNQVVFHAGNCTLSLSLESGFSLQTDRWYHLAGTNDGASLKLFVDGAQVATTASAGAPCKPTAVPIVIGRTGPYDLFFFPGAVDEVRIWGIARSTTQIQQAMRSRLVGNESGLVGLWRFNEGSGTTGTDATAGGNTANLRNGATWVGQTW